jgi:colicin import membrane protein
VSSAGLESTISLRERSFRAAGADDRLPKWFGVSLILHLFLIAGMFLAPMLPSNPPRPPEATVVELVGGERIGAANLGTDMRAPAKQELKAREESPPAPKKELDKEAKKEEPAKEIKAKTREIEKKSPPPEEKIAIREKSKTEAVKNEPVKDTRKEPAKEDSKTDTASADSVRERLIQGAVERAKTRSEAAQKTKGEPFSAGNGEGIGAAALGSGGRGGPGVVRGMDFIIYQNRIRATIKENWAWVGQQRSNLKVVVRFGIKENGEIVGLKISQPSGDPSYDESVLRAVRKSSPLTPPPESYRADFADVEITFLPQDLGA